jgi:hypothetical protein
MFQRALLAYGHPSPRSIFRHHACRNGGKRRGGKAEEAENPATTAIVGTRSERWTPPTVLRRPDLPSKPPMAASSRRRPHPPTPTLSFWAHSAASAAAHRGSGGSASLPASHRLLHRGEPRRRRLRLDLRREGGEEEVWNALHGCHSVGDEG